MSGRAPRRTAARVRGGAAGHAHAAHAGHGAPFRSAPGVGTPVVLARPTPRDRDEFLAACVASAGLHHGLVVPPRTPAEYDGYLERAATEDTPWPRWLCRLVRAADTGALVGAVNLNEIAWGGSRSGALGYYAFAGHAGRGYLRAALHAFLAETFGRHVQLHRMEALVRPGNVRSRALVERLGFRFEGVSKQVIFLDGAWHDHERWALLADEWRAGAGRAGG